MNWPNRITLLRLLLVAPFVVLMQHQQAQPVCRYVAMGLLMVVAASDVADGFLARRLASKTRLGAILDPLADKALITCAAVLLALPHSSVRGARLPDWVVVTIVGKDLWVVIGFAVLFLLTGKVRVRPAWAGKLCTAAQLAMVLAVLISPELNRLVPQLGRYLATVLWWIVAALSLAATISYTRMGLAFLAEEEPPNSSARSSGQA